MKNIEKLTNREEIIREINEENKNFDLKDFYANNRNAAVMIISEDNIVKSYSIFSHKTVAEQIIKTIDPEFNKFYNLSTIWQNQATKKILFAYNYVVIFNL